MLKAIISFYNEQSSPHATVAMLGSVVCPRCNGRGLSDLDFERFYPHCERCKGDGFLTNQLQFNSQLMECAAAPTFLKEQGWKMGDVVKVINPSGKLTSISGLALHAKPPEITVRITDLMKDGLCRCGHHFNMHQIKPASNGNQMECLNCLTCKQYEMRCLDLTEKAFSLLAPLSVGILEAEVEKI